MEELLLIVSIALIVASVFMLLWQMVALRKAKADPLEAAGPSRGFSGEAILPPIRLRRGRRNPFLGRAEGEVRRKAVLVALAVRRIRELRFFSRAG